MNSKEIRANLKNKERIVIKIGSSSLYYGESGNMNLGMTTRPSKLPEKQACAAVGQARLMMIYQKIFNEYNHVAGQVLMTKHTITNNLECKNTQNTFLELLKLGVVPIVNENDTVSTSEIKVGDNDKLSAVVASIIDADLLIMLSDIDGLYTDDPNTNPEAGFIDFVDDMSFSIWVNHLPVLMWVPGVWLPSLMPQ